MRAIDNGIAVTRHYYDAAGNRITSATAGETVTVKITARARDGSDVIPNVAITDLLPGAMTAIPDTITGPITYGAIREDRVQIFADITRGGSEFTYTATVTTPGRFAIAPINAASMYNPSIRAVGDGGTFIVTDGTTK